MQESILSTKRNTKASFFGDWTPGSSTSLSKKSTPHTWEAVLLETQAKQKITQNKKLLIIGIFSIISLAIILETFFTVSWILINETDQYEYWVSLLSVEKLCKDLPAGEAQLLCHQSNQVIYTFQTSDFFSSNCQADMLTTDDPENLCSILRIFRITGLIACFGVVIGMLLHLFCVLQYLRLTCKRGKVNINQPVLVRLLIVTIIFYVVSWIVWIVFSLLMAEDATNSSFFGRLGSSFYLYFFSVVVFIGLVWWFKKSMASDVKMKLVTALLGTTKKYNIETKETQIELQEIKIVGALEATEQ